MISEAVQLEIVRQMPTICTILVGFLIGWLKLKKIEHTMNSGLEVLEQARLTASNKLTEQAVQTARLEERVRDQASGSP